MEEVTSERIPIMGVKNSATANTWTSFARILNAVVVCTALVAAFLVIYSASVNSFERLLPSFTSVSSIPSPCSPDAEPFDAESYELSKVLKAAATKERTVILTTLNEAWTAPNSVFDLFLQSFRVGDNTTWLLNHLLVIALDEKAYSRCQVSVSHCYFLKTNQSSEMAGHANFMTPIYLDMLWKRLALLHTVLRLGYNYVFTDTDVMWFRDPFPHFTNDSDFQTACDKFNGQEFRLRNLPNNGFVFARSNCRTIRFYKIWISSRHLYPKLHEQDVFNRIKHDAIGKVGLKVRFLGTDYFGGYCSPSRDFSKVCTMHANCCVGLDRKTADLNTTLEDWKHYFYANQTASQSFHWRVPNKCSM